MTTLKNLHCKHLIWSCNPVQFIKWSAFWPPTRAKCSLVTDKFVSGWRLTKGLLYFRFILNPLSLCRFWFQNHWHFFPSRLNKLWKSPRNPLNYPASKKVTPYILPVTTKLRSPQHDINHRTPETTTQLPSHDINTAIQSPSHDNHNQRTTIATKR